MLGTTSLRVVAAVAVAIAVVVSARAATPVVPWAEAGEHVGEMVAVEGDVVDAAVEPGMLVLRFATDQPDAFRVVLVIAMFSDLPRRPERLYLGNRIRATGTVRRFAGRPEMVLRTSDAIEVVGVASGSAGRAAATPAAPAPAVTVPAPAARATPAPEAPHVASRTASAPTAPAVTSHPAPATASRPTSAPGTASPAVTPPAPATGAAGAPAAAPPAIPPTAAADDEDVPPSGLGRLDPCVRARDRWDEAAEDARRRIAALDACLARGRAGCRDAAGAVAPALSALEWAEQEVEDACP